MAGALSIRLAPPAQGARELICKTDEATVSRVIAPGRYAGMVERLQVMEKAGFSVPMLFHLYHDRDGVYPYQFSPQDPADQILRFLSLRFAKTLFPDNFVDARETRISRPGGGLVSAMYSGYVPDETGVIARRSLFMSRYYDAEGEDERRRIQRRFDLEERRSCPDLARAINAMELSGLVIPHPEANYHLSGGDVVFFEVLGIRLRRAFAMANELARDPEESFALLSMIHAVMLRHYSRANPAYFSFFKEYRGIGLDEIYSSVLWLLADMASFYPRNWAYPGARLFEEDIHASFHEVFQRAAYAREGLTSPWKADMPVAIDPSLV